MALAVRVKSATGSCRIAVPNPSETRRRSHGGRTDRRVSDPLTGIPGPAGCRSRPLSRSHSRWNSQPGSRCSPPDPGFRLQKIRARQPLCGLTARLEGERESLLSPRCWVFRFSSSPRLTAWAAFFSQSVAATAACQARIQCSPDSHLAWDNLAAANSSAFCRASAALTFTSGSTPVPSQFVLVIGFTARANGTPIMK